MNNQKERPAGEQRIERCPECGHIFTVEQPAKASTDTPCPHPQCDGGWLKSEHPDEIGQPCHVCNPKPKQDPCTPPKP